MSEYRQYIPLTTKHLSLILLGSALVVIYFIPADVLFGEGEGFCIHKKILGFGCPGCGMTRAIYCFLHLDFYRAAHFNYAVFALFPFLISQTIFQLTYNKLFYFFKKISLYIFLLLLGSIYLSRIIIVFT